MASEKKQEKNKKQILSKQAFEQISSGLKKFKKVIEHSKSKNFNESDTSNVIYDFLGEVLGYDKYLDITTEYRIKGQYCDYGIVLDGNLKLLMEVKQIGLELNDNHLFQAISYAGNEGVKWVILTNLRQWELYCLSFGEKIDKELIMKVDLLNESSINTLAEKLQYFHKESIVKDLLEDLVLKKRALSSENIKKVLFSEVIVKKIQSELKSLTGIKISTDEVINILKGYTKDK